MSSYEDVYVRKKRCTKCGCYMYDDTDSDICECCLDDIKESDPGDPEVDE